MNALNVESLRLERFPHQVGHHCSSSAVRSVLAYDGLNLSEALVFGLGSGVGFFYSVEPEGSPTRRFNGRAPDLEGNLYRLAGSPLEWAGSWRPELIHEGLGAGRPILAQTDIHPIPYYDDAHFIGHGLAVIGAEGNDLLVADIASPEVLTMPIDAFHAAVALKHAPLLEPYHYAVAPRLEALGVPDLTPKALERTVRYMLEPPSTGEGVAGIGAFAADLPSWAELPDRAWCARFGYQAIEKRGTGGGNFRLLFRDFLAETQPHTGVSDAVIADFGLVAKGWSEVGDLLKEAAFAEGESQRGLFARAAERVSYLALREAALFERLGGLLR